MMERYVRKFVRKRFENFEYWFQYDEDDEDDEDDDDDDDDDDQANNEDKGKNLTYRCTQY